MESAIRGCHSPRTGSSRLADGSSWKPGPDPGGKLPTPPPPKPPAACRAAFGASERPQTERVGRHGGRERTSVSWGCRSTWRTLGGFVRRKFAVSLMRRSEVCDQGAGGVGSFRGLHGRNLQCRVPSLWGPPASLGLPELVAASLQPLPPSPRGLLLCTSVLVLSCSKDTCRWI